MSFITSIIEVVKHVFKPVEGPWAYVLFFISAALIMCGSFIDFSQHNSSPELEIQIKNQVILAGFEFYDLGYQDFKNNKEQQILDTLNINYTKRDGFFKGILPYWLGRYKEGYQDAKNNLPNQFDEIKKEITHKLKILEEIKNTTNEMLWVVDSLQNDLKRPVQ